MNYKSYERYRVEVENAINAFEDILSACDKVKESGACERCPFRASCIEEATFEQFVCDEATRGNLAEMFGFAEDIENYISEEDFISNMEDMRRKETDYWYD